MYAMCIQTMTIDAEVVDAEVRRHLLLEWALMEHLAGEGQKSLNVLVLVAGGSEPGKLFVRAETSEAKR